MSRFQVQQVAVLGAGVMGAQIAAHLINVRIPVLLFDLPAPAGSDGRTPPNAIALQAIEGLKKLKPAPLGWAADAALITPANYQDDLEQLRGCALIIEAIAERLDFKRDLYQKIAPYVAEGALLASNTSGLSIQDLSDALPSALRHRFCGVHFFNPPRYMPLVELIAGSDTQAEVLDQLETFATTALGKNVVRAHDTPNFIANRLGVAGMLSTLLEAERLGLSYDVVDDLTGKRLGRASSGTLRTADVVGLDTLAHVVRTLQDKLSPQTDPFYASYATPAVLQTLLDMGHLGQKTGAGFYKKVGREVLRFNPFDGRYVSAGQKADEVYARMLKRPAAERLPLLRHSEGAPGQFVWAVLRNSFHYAAVHLQTLADNARDVDQAMRWGFGMQQGPFELWQEAGWLAVAHMIQEDIAAGKTLCSAPLPDWVLQGPVAERGGPHQPEGSWNPRTASFDAPRALPVYQRQCVRATVGPQAAIQAQAAGRTIYQDEAIRLWTLDDEVLIATTLTKMHTLSPAAVAGLLRAVDMAEASYQGLVLWTGDDTFCAGADLHSMLPGLVQGGPALIDHMEAELQRMMLRLRYAQVPVVAAVRGLALGGGCELALYCARRVAHLESYMGLVEVGVGLLPGGGGLTHIARQAAERAQTSTGTDLLPFLSAGFKAAAMATVSSSALEARQLGYLQASDPIVPHHDELLHVALQEARTLHSSGYRPPLRRTFAVAGRSGYATILGQLVNLRDGGLITAHDFFIASQMAQVVTGGDVDAGTQVDEAYLMTLERRGFGTLITHPQTHERIMGMLATGKPLRN